ncbi:HlyC/CorC family transporter [Marinibactrum halimedae]|uniref:Magnesium and cobalt efflux protein CorC n=1 Tax=Marinibactrum halimedae TaxID=1444977 RepID=A0AA37TA62_9GAMM|nr:transporter associated domain-containing protein [Marinibactrum halimedae]MCD9457407.1 CBS domain-containing protein [Marinibactrum halimedae]GLS25542.1 ion transporter [Marinibactrum halimedae]
MSDDPSSSTPSSRGQEKSWFEKLMGGFSAEPKSREDLIKIIKDAANNNLLDEEAVSIIEGAMDVQDQQVRNVMVPRSQMVVVNLNDDPEAFLTKVMESGHSRFPVVGDTIDDIKGILLAKDLLPLILSGTKDFRLENVIRPASIIPESKRLNVLLREFRENRYHMALVIDEYGAISGLVTIEDVLEEIVGEIEDETDEDDDESFIRKVADNEYIIKALLPIEDFNEEFGAQFSEEEFDTIGGILMRAFGHLPQRNEHTDIDGYTFRVLYADSRQIHLLRLTTPGPH